VEKVPESSASCRSQQKQNTTHEGILKQNHSDLGRWPAMNNFATANLIKNWESNIPTLIDYLKDQNSKQP